METPTQPDPHWLARSQALGKAQSRYLWVMLIAAVFYAALGSAQPSALEPSLRVPVLELQLDSRIVLALGPAVLSFLILIFMGSLRAYGEAYRNLDQGPTPNFDADRFDLYPNAIDLAMYTTKSSPRLILVLTYFSYPLLLTLVLAEAAYMACDLFSTDRTIRFRLVFVAVGVILWAPAAWLVVSMWVRRLRRIPDRWRSGAA